MNTTYKTIVGIIAAIIIVVVGIIYLVPNHSSVKGISGTGEPSGFDNVSLTGGLKVGVAQGDVSLPGYGVGSIWASSTIISSSTLYAQGGITSGGICSISSASTTATIYLTNLNLLCTELSITSGTSTTLIVTLPASSTMTALSYPGDASNLYIYAASTTAGNLIIAGTTTAGFSINSTLGIASTTAATTTVIAGEAGIFDYFRLSTTDMYGMITPNK